MSYVEITDEHGDERIVPVRGHELLIGRGEECDVMIVDALASREHAVLERGHDGWTVEDLESTNGVTLNGETVSRAPLGLGDVLCVGSHQIRLCAGAPPDGVLVAYDQVAVAGFDHQDPTKVDSQRRLALFLEIAAGLDSFDSPGELLSRCGEIVVGIFRPACCLVRIGDETWGYETGSGGKTGREVPARKAVLERVDVRSEAVLWRATEPASHGGNGNGNGSASGAAVTAMGVPILVGKEPVGLVYVDRRRSGSVFGEEDLLCLVGVARLVGGAIAGAGAPLRRVAEEEGDGAPAGAARKLIGDSLAIRKLRRTIEQRLGPVHANVLLLGETGTGKTLVAEAIHDASPRRRGPLVKVNCAAIPRELLESELFGHEKGAFSGATRTKPGQFEVASGGTLFLDEVGELDPSAQAKLLAVIQDRQVQRVGGTQPIGIDARILAATNRDLRKEVERGHFRDDLYYRLNVVSLQLLPLRERAADIPLLAGHFLERACEEVGRRIPGIDPQAMDLLEAYAWPGNVRELSNCLQRAVVFGDEGVALGVEQLPDEIAEGSVESDASEERDTILDALERAGGNKRQAARLLGWYPQKLYHRLKRYGIG